MVFLWVDDLATLHLFSQDYSFVQCHVSGLSGTLQWSKQVETWSIGDLYSQETCETLDLRRALNTCHDITSCAQHIRPRLHIDSTVYITVFVPFKNGFNAIMWCCLHVTTKRSNVPLTKIVTMTVRLNDSSGEQDSRHEVTCKWLCSHKAKN